MRSRVIVAKPTTETPKTPAATPENTKKQTPKAAEPSSPAAKEMENE